MLKSGILRYEIERTATHAARHKQQFIAHRVGDHTSMAYKQYQQICEQCTVYIHLGWLKAMLK